GIHSIQDLLFHLPMRYQDRTRITPIGALQVNSDVVVQGKVLATDVVMGRRRSLLCRVSDGTGSISLRFFHFTAGQKNNLKIGAEVRCFGEPR
ncbi:MAG: ATP-dependent DNA helicase RecG, partial [Endozoicomonas sp.]